MTDNIPLVPAGSAVTTPNQMLDEIRALRTDVGTMSSKLDHSFQAQQDDIRDIKEKQADHEARLRVLERWKYKSAGAVGVVSAVVSVGLSFAVEWIVNAH